MRILVCVKQVPDTTEIRIDPETHSMIRTGVPSVLNIFDRYAMEVALRLREQAGEGHITVLSMGPAQAEAVLRECLALGADAAYLATDRAFGGADTLATSYVLAQAIRVIGDFDLVLCGKQAIDGDTAQVGPEIAQHLGWPQVTNAAELTLQGDEYLAKRETDDGYEMLLLPPPGVVTVTKPPFEPRYPSVKGKLAAKRAEIHILSTENLPLDTAKAGLKGSPTRVRRTYTPAVKTGGVKVEGLPPRESVAGLLEFLQEKVPGEA